MKEFIISVNIADRPYRLKAGAEEEEAIRKAAKEIDEQIKEYSRHYAYNDKQDLLAMAALHFALSAIKCTKEQETLKEALDSRIRDIEKVV